MSTDIKQAMHVDACKSFGTAEANENERRWDEDKIDRKNQDPTNHYDKTRMKLNFEIGPDGKIHPLGYQEKPLEVRLQERLAELGWKPFKPDSKIQPNCCAKFIFGGNHDRTLEMAFGTQTVNLDKGADNSHLQRCPEIEQWAKDDENSPHIHALIVPVGQRAKSGRECVVWSAKFGKTRYEYGQILREMHTSLYEEVGSKYGLERGDSIVGRNVQHLHKRDYIRKLAKEAKQAEKAVKGLQTMIRKLEREMLAGRNRLKEIDAALASGKITLDRYEVQKSDIQKLIAEYQEKLEDKSNKLHAKEQELEQITKDAAKARSVIQPFRNHKVDFTPPQITEKVPLFGTDKWIERQNRLIAKQFTEIVRKIESLYRNDAARLVEAAQRNVLADYRELYQLRRENKTLSDTNKNLESELNTLLSQLAISSVRNMIFAVADALISGQPIPVSSGGGGGNSDSDLRWDGRRPDEKDDEYRKRCLMFAIGMVKRQYEKKSYRR